MARRILHLDVDAFFAAAEQRDDPSLRGRPVAVGTGVVASCSYESRPFGVRTGMRLGDARRLCPALVVVPGDYRRYEIASRQIVGIAREHSPLIEVVALDDLYLEGGDAARIAAQVRQEVGLRVTIGVGASKLVAAVATQEAKERKARGGTDDVAEVPPGTEREYLAPWPVEVLPGVGPKAAEQLGRLNVRRVRELAEVPAAVLAGMFGKRGLAFRELARGIDPRPVQPGKPALSISRCTSFDPAVAEWPVLSAMMDHLVERAALRARKQGQQARGLGVKVRYADHRTADSRVPVDGGEEGMKRAARERLERLCGRRLPLRLIGVELSPLLGTSEQGELFADEGREKAKRLRECRDEVRERFGFLSLVSGSALELTRRLEHDRDNYALRTPCLTR
ncbi:MAG: DNA polymerase IV [Gemmataceae bacterium]|nr:DNA polymerase IV [Gemmataceae bacterium]